MHVLYERVEIILKIGQYHSLDKYSDFMHVGMCRIEKNFLYISLTLPNMCRKAHVLT